MGAGARRRAPQRRPRPARRALDDRAAEGWEPLLAIADLAEAEDGKPGVRPCEEARRYSSPALAPRMTRTASSRSQRSAPSSGTPTRSTPPPSSRTSTPTSDCRSATTARARGSTTEGSQRCSSRSPSPRIRCASAAPRHGAIGVTSSPTPGTATAPPKPTRTRFAPPIAHRKCHTVTTPVTTGDLPVTDGSQRTPPKTPSVTAKTPTNTGVVTV